MAASDAVPAMINSSTERASLWERARPPIYRGIPYVRIALVMLVIFIYRNVRTEGRAQEQLFNTWLLYTIVVIGFYFVFGLSGQFAFSQAAIFGLGGYASAWAVHNPDHPIWFGPLAAVIICLAAALTFSLIMQRTEHFYFAVGTLGLQNVITTVLLKWKGFTHGAGGEVSNIRPWTIFGHEMVTAYQGFKLLFFSLTVALILAMALERSPIRREAIANRDKPLVGRTLGLPSLRIRITMFMLGSFFAAIAGSLTAHRETTLGIEGFGVELGLFIFLMAILGGLGSPWGAMLGAWFFVYARSKIELSGVKIGDHTLREFKTIIFGAILILVMILLPDGLLGVGKKVRRLIRNDPRPGLPTWLAISLGLARPPEPPLGEMPVSAHLVGANAAKPERGAPVLEANEISVSFGGVRAVNEVSITLHEYEILGLIGPNGSGKSTFVNAVTGVVPARGDLRAGDRSVPLGDPKKVRNAGVLRTFQTPQTFLHLSCIENVLLTTTDRKFTGILSSIVLRPLMLKHEKTRWRHAAAALDRVGLLDRAEDSAVNLSYGQQRLLELARTLCGNPSFVLLDEASAGLNAAETELLAGHLRRMRQDGMSLLVIDHKIDFITSVVDRVVVLDLGNLVAEGDPSNIWQDPNVQNAYIGVADQAAVG
jgi:branched-chain amino acid transport system permease protein